MGQDHSALLDILPPLATAACGLIRILQNRPQGQKIRVRNRKTFDLQVQVNDSITTVSSGTRKKIGIAGEFAMVTVRGNDDPNILFYIDTVVHAGETLVVDGAPIQGNGDVPQPEEIPEEPKIVCENSSDDVTVSSN